MNPKAICTDMAFHHHQAFNRQREENSHRITYTVAEPSRDGVRLLNKFLLALVEYSF